MMQAEQAIVRGEKNRVGNTFLRFVRAHPDPDRWQVNAPTLKRRIDPRTGLVTYYADFNYHNEPDAFVTKVGGKPVLIQMYGKDGRTSPAPEKHGHIEPQHRAALHAHPDHHHVAAGDAVEPELRASELRPRRRRSLHQPASAGSAAFVKQFSKHLFPAIKGSFTRSAARPPAVSMAMPSASSTRPAAASASSASKPRRHQEEHRTKPAPAGRRLDQQVRERRRGRGHGFEIVNGAIENATRLAAFMAARDVGMTRRMPRCSRAT
jgi:hypothetical protein